MSKQEIGTWDNSTEYAGLDDTLLRADLDRVVEATLALKTLSSGFSAHMDSAENLDPDTETTLIGQARQASDLYYNTIPRLYNIGTFAYCELSLDGKNEAAKVLVARVQELGASLGQALTPVTLFLSRTSEAAVERYLEAEARRPERFLILYERTRKDLLLSLKEEEMILGLSVNGKTAWGNLYTNLSGEIECKVALPTGEETMGLAQASTLAEDPDPAVRKAGYRAVQAGWKQHEISCAAAMNALSGWRRTVCEMRAHTKPVHFLDEPTFDARIQRGTLDCMVSTVYEHAETARQVLRLQAKGVGVEKLGPWDLFVPPPVDAGGDKIPFDKAIDMIREAFGSVGSEMADFVTTMVERNWIDGRAGPNKLPGAYCTEFYKSRTPRVYMTYQGGMNDVLTLAHELGHAFHSWVMRDMPLPRVDYPMTLAETASVFAEAVVYDYLLQQASSPRERFRVLWGAARELPSFLINIPARFEFEKSFYEARAEKVLSPGDITKLSTAAWDRWYGDTLSEMDPMFWAWKQHFYITGLSFYNFPYMFGYLFSLGVYSRKDQLGDDFYASYVALLRETGSLTAEDLAQKHLDADLTQPGFWLDSLAVAKYHADEFEKVVKEVGVECR